MYLLRKIIMIINQANNNSKCKINMKIFNKKAR